MPRFQNAYSQGSSWWVTEIISVKWEDDSSKNRKKNDMIHNILYDFDFDFII